MGVLGAHVAGTGKLGPLSRHKFKDQPYDLDLWVGGLTARARRPDEHLRWGGRRELKVGDEIVIRILSASTADAPTERMPAQGRPSRPKERERFESAKAIYLALRGKFERRRRLTARSTPTRRKRRAG
jgi:hypothetical protein